MITLNEYKRLSHNFKKNYVVKKGIRYHLSTIDGKNIINDGPIEEWEKENRRRKSFYNKTSIRYSLKTSRYRGNRFDTNYKGRISFVR